MGFLLVLPILICGFIYCRYNFYDRTLISKFEGQALYLHIAMRGITIVLPTLGVTFLAEWFSSGFFGLSDALALHGVTKLDEKNLFTTLLACVCISPLVAYAAARLRFAITKIRYKLQTNYLTELFILQQMLPLTTHQTLLLESLTGRLLYMFSMEDRKIYIGCVAGIGGPQDRESSFDEGFSIIPVFSGYRDKDTLTVRITTRYDRVFEAIKKARVPASAIATGTEDAAIRSEEQIDALGTVFSISLLQKNIVSMTRFEHDVWNQFEQHERDNPTSPSSESSTPKTLETAD
jgi:hypothetical protein